MSAPHVFPLRPRNLRAEGLRAIGMGILLVVAGLLGMGGSLGTSVSVMRIVAVMLMLTGVFRVGEGVLMLFRGRGPRDIEVDGEGITALPNSLARRRARVRFADIRAILLQQGRGGARLLVGSTGPSLAFDSEELADPEDVARVALLLRERIQRLPHGAERLEWIDGQVSLTRRLLERRPVFTYAMLAAIGLAFLLQVSSGALQSPVEMIRLGAGAPALVAAGEWYRLISANFLHAIEAHIFVNGLALWMLGGLLERIIGPWRLAGVYLFSALGGAAASMLFSSAAFMVGSSTAMFGLVGALVTTDRVYRWQLPPVFRQSPQWWGLILGINVLVSVAVPLIDLAAHAGGFLAGALAAWILLPRDGRFRPDAPAPRHVRVIALGLGALFVVGIGQAVRNARDFDAAAALNVVAQHEDIDPVTLNDIAWMTIIDPEADRATLEVTLAMAERAVAAEPESAAFLDTRAGALHRLGATAAAVADERAAFARQPNPIYAAHLAQMAAALPALSEVEVRRDGNRIELAGAAFAGGGALTVLATFEQAGKPGGLFYGRAQLEAGQGPRLAPVTLERVLPESVSLTIRWIGPSLGVEGERTRDGEYQAWPPVGAGELPAD